MNKELDVLLDAVHILAYTYNKTGDSIMLDVACQIYEKAKTKKLSKLTLESIKNKIGAACPAFYQGYFKQIYTPKS